MKYLLLLILISCKNKLTFVQIPDGDQPTVNIVKHIPSIDDAIVRARATIQVNGSSSTVVMNAIKSLLTGTAYAANATITVTYTYTASVTFTLNTASFGAGTIDSNDYLSLGSLTVTALTDNNLKVCNPGGNTKCTTAGVRAYTTGEKTVSSGHSIAGFIHTVDEYGTDVFADKTASPTQLVGKGAINASVMQTYTIPGNKNKIRLSDFPTPTYNARSDFSNAGSGSYSMVFVVEYYLTN